MSLYAWRCARATIIVAARNVYNLLRCLFVGGLVIADACLHVFHRCCLRRRYGPGQVFLRTFVPRDEDVIEREPPVPTKIYVCDPQLRADNVFLPLTRPMPKDERKLVDAEQAHVRKCRAEAKRKKLARKLERARYAAKYLGETDELAAAKLARLESAIAIVDAEIARQGARPPTPGGTPMLAGDIMSEITGKKEAAPPFPEALPTGEAPLLIEPAKPETDVEAAAPAPAPLMKVDRAIAVFAQRPWKKPEKKSYAPK